MIHFTPTDLTLLLGFVLTGISSLVLVCQRSTCTRIECCCIKCDRKVRTLQIIEAEQNPYELEIYFF